MTTQTMLSITHTPVATPAKKEITIDMVENLYVGKGNCCRCGCGGEYFTPEEHAKKIQRSIKKMASGKYEVSSINDYIFEIVISERETSRGEMQTRVHTLYLKK
jgi:hypothetical protein